MKKTIWKSILCAMLITLTACVLCTGAFAAKYTCIKSGCTREAAKGSAYCWVHKPTKSNSIVSGSGSRPSGSSSTKHKYTCIKDGCTREADKDSAYCWVHRPSKSSTKSSTSYSSKSSYSKFLLQQRKNPTRRMIPMTMATMPSMMMTTTMRIATTATRLRSRRR